MTAARPSGTPSKVRVRLLVTEPDGVVTIALNAGPEDVMSLLVQWREMLDLAAEIMHSCVHAAQLAGVPLGEVKATAGHAINTAFNCDHGGRS